MKLNDFFCGGGGFGIGFKQAGFEIVGAWDNDKTVVEAYKHNVGDHVGCVDIRNMTWKDVPFADVWTFGFPCQDLSKQGKMAGVKMGCDKCDYIVEVDKNTQFMSYNCTNCDGGTLRPTTRSGMFFEIMRLLDEVEINDKTNKPKMLLAENVLGVKNLIPVIENEFKKRGYKLKAQKFNSVFWGVPQNRERYYLAGYLEGEFEFPEEGEEISTNLIDVLESDVDGSYYMNSELITIVKGEIRVKQATKKGYDVAVVGDSINISHPKSKTRRGRVGKQKAQTLLTSKEQIVALDDGFRYFTPRESLRIQGFPDDYEMNVPDNKIYFISGNAVTVPLVRNIAEKIKEHLMGGGENNGSY